MFLLPRCLRYWLPAIKRFKFFKKKIFSRGYRIKQGTQQIIAYNVLQLLGLIESISKYSRDTRLSLNEKLA